jgi:hypothetical protein
MKSKDVYLICTQEGDRAPKKIKGIVNNMSLADECAKHETKMTGDGHWVETAKFFEDPRTVKWSDIDPSCGELLTMSEFIDLCILGALIDYDGYGHYSNGIQETNIGVKPSDVKANRHDNSYSHVVWYNR